jgi:hypothetical protein
MCQMHITTLRLPQTLSEAAFAGAERAIAGSGFEQERIS